MATRAKKQSGKNPELQKKPKRPAQADSERRALLMWAVALSVSVGTGVGTAMWTNWQNERRHREMLAAAAARSTSAAIATPAKLGDSVVVSESVAVAMGISSAEAFGAPSLS